MRDANKALPHRGGAVEALREVKIIGRGAAMIRVRPITKQAGSTSQSRNRTILSYP